MITYKSKVQIIYEKLKDDINSGIFKPGERIIISQIAKQNDISDIPVREAVRTLESEGLVKVLPNIGPIIAPLNIEDIKEHFILRGLLEGYAARVSIDYLTAEIISQLESKIDEMYLAIADNNLKAYGLLNKEFHTIIYKTIPYRNLYNNILELWDRYERTRSVFVLSPERTMVSIIEHKKIIELLKNKKYDEIEPFMRVHKQEASDELIRYLKSTLVNTYTENM